MLLFEKIQLEAGERVLTTVRKHWFVIVFELAGIGLVMLLPIFLLISTAFVPEIPLFESLLYGQAPLIVYGLCAWLLCTLIIGFTIWTHYYLDLWVITDRRVIVIDQVAFFNRKISSFRLERLQDIKVTINGLIHTLFNFGTVRAQTAGANESNFMSHNMPDPRAVQSIIQSAMDARLQTLNGNVFA